MKNKEKALKRLEELLAEGKEIEKKIMDILPLTSDQNVPGPKLEMIDIIYRAWASAVVMMAERFDMEKFNNMIKKYNVNIDSIYSLPFILRIMEELRY